MPGSFPGTRGRHAGVEVVPDAVRRARHEAGLSQAQVAEPEYTRAAVHMVESGRMRPSTRLLRQIAQRTGRPVAYFIADTAVTSDHREASDELRQLVATARFDDAIELGERLLEGELPRAVEAEVSFLVGRAHVRTLNGRGAQPHLARARTLYEQIGDQVQLADVLNQTASALYLLDDPKTLPMALQALEACERLRPPVPELTVRTLLVLGMVFKRLQDWPRAIDYYERALELSDPAPGLRNLALVHDQLSQTYQRQGRLGVALRHARRAARLHASSLDPTDLFRAEHNLGETLLRSGELAAARPHLERALELCDERGLERQARGFALLSLADLRIELGQLDEADRHLGEAGTLVEQLEERIHQAAYWRLRGRWHVRRGEHPEADAAFASSAALYEALQLPADVLDVLAEHIAALRSQGRIDEALRLAERALSSGRLAARRMQVGWGDLVAAHWAG